LELFAAVCSGLEAAGSIVFQISSKEDRHDGAQERRTGASNHHLVKKNNATCLYSNTQ